MKKRIFSQGLGMAAMAFLVQATFLEKEPSAKEPVIRTVTAENSDLPTVRIALLLDTSNSMDGLINQAKARLWDIVNEFTYARCDGDKRPKLEIALYQYGNDYLASSEGYVQQVLGFSNDLDEISAKLFSLSTNGGEEYCGVVVQKALRQLNWGKNKADLKFIFIAGNEPFNQGTTPFEQVMKDAREKDVVVNTIFCGDYRQGVNTLWQKGALLSGGAYSSIDHNQHLVHVKTPYDDVILKLNRQLNNTYVSYGARGRAKKEAQAVQDSNAEIIEAEVAVNRAVSKSSALYRNSQWDLVDALDEEVVTVEELDQEDLPSELQGKSAGVVVKYVEAKKAERARIQAEIQKVNQQRQAYIDKQQQSSASDDLKAVLVKMIREQGAQKNLSWDNP